MVWSLYGLSDFDLISGAPNYVLLSSFILHLCLIMKYLKVWHFLSYHVTDGQKNSQSWPDKQTYEVTNLRQKRAINTGKATQDNYEAPFYYLFCIFLYQKIDFFI